MQHESLLARRAAGLSASPIPPESQAAIPFDSGHAYPGLLPDLTRAAERALTRYRSETLQYAPRPGLPEMREWVAGYLAADGTPTAADEVIMVNGAKHGIELVCRLLLDEGDTIAVTAPTYFTAIPIFRSFGASFLEVPQDAEGMDVDALEQSLARLAREGRALPKLVYNVPEFHNPTSVSMSRQRREALVDLARRHGVFVLEDSPYRKICFEGAVEPTLKSLDQHGCVLTVGTFSKLVAPGIRVGWITAPPPLVNRIARLKADGGSSPLLQRTILEFCRTGGIDEHARLAQATYRTHRDCMVDALRRALPQAAFEVPRGGYYVWLTLPPQVDGDELARRAAGEGVTVIPGSSFFAGPDHPRNHVRLAYSHASPEGIDEGVQRLARAYASMTS